MLAILPANCKDVITVIDYRSSKIIDDRFELWMQLEIPEDSDHMLRLDQDPHMR